MAGVPGKPSPVVESVGASWRDSQRLSRVEGPCRHRRLHRPTPLKPTTFFAPPPPSLFQLLQAPLGWQETCIVTNKVIALHTANTANTPEFF